MTDPLAYLAAAIVTVPPAAWLAVAAVALAVAVAAHWRRGRGDDLTPEQYGADRP